MAGLVKTFGLILFFSVYCQALFEDQVGKFDWKQSFVGRVKFSHIDIKPTGLQRVFVTTENNVVACLGPSGLILWRNVIEEGELGVIHALHVGNEVVTVSGSGPYLLRGWNPDNGLLLFEWSLPSVGFRDLHWTFDQSKAYQVRLLDGALEVTGYHLKSGNAAGSTKTVTATWLSRKSKCLVRDGAVVCISEKKLNYLPLSEQTVVSVDLPADLPSPSTLDFVPSDYPAAVFSGVNGNKNIIVLTEDRRVFSAEIPPGTTAAVRKSELGPELYFLKTEDQYSIKSIFLADKKPGKTEKSITHNQRLPFGVASSIACLSETKDDSCYILLVGEDDTLILLNDDEVSFVREEALANIVAVEMIDLPVSDEEAAIEKEFANKEAWEVGVTSGIVGMTYRRLHSQLMQAKNSIISLLGLRDHGSESRADLVRDRFGLHRLMIIVTRASKVFGMENDQGEIVWQFHLKKVSSFVSYGKETVPFYVQRTSRHFPHPPICTLIFKETSGLSALYVFNPISGQPLYGGMIPLGYAVKQSLLLPTENDQFVKGLVLLSSSDDVYVFPKSTYEVAVEVYRHLYMYTVEPDLGVVQGYAFFLEDDKKLTVSEVWNLRLAPPIIQVATKNRDERVHSQGRVLADRSVLYKYLNPHLVVVVTHTPDQVHKNIVSVYLVDTVSGAIVFSCSHKRATPPVHVVHSENWVVYSFFNDKSKRTEIVALDLYEGTLHRNTTVFSSLSSGVDPIVDKQAYIFPNNIVTMKETITEKGITSKHVLVGVSSGSVLEVPWMLFDPRRSPDGREEGVIPYTPELTLPNEATLTYNHSLPSIAGIHTSPSGLESTSLVLLYGLDLFYTRVAPSKTFDVLKDDFEYCLITVVVGGLIIAAVVSKKIASRKALKQAWK